MYLCIDKNQGLLHPQHNVLTQNNILILRFMTILILLIVWLIIKWHIKKLGKVLILYYSLEKHQLVY